MVDARANRSLNPLLRMAALAGVESAVRLHVRRGDDLDARDAAGMTALMLAASKNKAAVCSLLVSAGSDMSLKDPAGRDALAIATVAGAAEAARVLAAFLPKPPMEAEVPKAQQVPGTGSGADLMAEVEEFDLSEWEAEEELQVPEGNPALAEAAAIVHRAIGAHRPIDTAEDWADFDASLPEFAAGTPDAGGEARSAALKGFLLRAAREGSVPARDIETLCAAPDGALDEDAWRALVCALAEIGAETDERLEDAIEAPDPTEAEEESVAGAMAFLEDLRSGRNEPLRLYIRDMRHEKFLTANQEIELGRAVEEGLAEALDALASWPHGVVTALAAIERAKAEEAPLAQSADVDQEEAEDEPADEATGSSDASGEFVQRTEEIARLARHAGQGGEGQRELRDALAAANPSRALIANLAAHAERDTGEAAVAFARAARRQTEAWERLVVSNLRLVISIAKRYQGMGLALDDLIQEGNIGLMKAADRFDWRKGFRFSTYATWWIRQQVTRGLADKGKTIRTPVHVHTQSLRIVREAEEMEREVGRPPSVAALAERVSMAWSRVSMLLRRIEEPSPIDQVGIVGDVGEDAEEIILLAELVEDPLAKDPIELAALAELRERFGAMATQLPERTAEVLTLRYGLGDEEPHTLEEIGALHGVTRERVRQIEAKGLRWFTAPLRMEMLRDFLPGDRRGRPTPTGSSASSSENTPEEVVPIQAEAPDAVELRTEPVAEDPRCKPQRELPSPNNGCQARRGIEKVLATAISLGCQVEDARDSGGAVTVRVGTLKGAVVRGLARSLIALGFTPFPGMIFRK